MSLIRERLPSTAEFYTAQSPEQLFARLADEPYSFFLDSGAQMGGGWGRYSWMSCAPFLVLRSRGQEIELIDRGGKRTRCRGDSLSWLDVLLDRYRLRPDRGHGHRHRNSPPPIAGAVGYFGYDLVRSIEDLPATTEDDLGMPDIHLGFYDTGLCFDHLTGRCIISAVALDDPAEDKIAALRRCLEKPVSVEDPPCRVAGASPIRSNFTREAYLEGIEAVQRYLRAGDVYQVNLSQRLETVTRLPGYAVYLQLRRINPEPFAAYLNFGEFKILSASPERFLKVTGRSVGTRPIKGTRPRGATPEEDRRLRGELLASEKDRAELMMIVDLERNDLGKVCRYGSVRVTELRGIEAHPKVFHTVSTVEGKLRSGVGAGDLLRATFPSGSVTGAPKVRAMEIIDELEPTRRGLYTGAIGRLGFDGTVDLNIVIRTIVMKRERVYYQVGGGIVVDSQSEAEYQETLDKAVALFDTLT
ncbi:MAG: aminodeoxychorismate synthase component I [Candidatus Bipolaricaulia bacterium]